MSSAHCQVLIPIFNNFPAAHSCLLSLERHTPSEIPVLLIDDGSSDGDFGEYLLSRGFKLPENWKLIRHPENCGFTKTVNRGFTATRPDDVLLLNSDTVVSAGWVRKLREAAYSDRKIATVTPLTNNGTVCSIPAFGRENELPAGYSVESFSELVESVSLRSYPKIPTCVGFCVYLKRGPLEEVGYLDEENFPRGYGEENDLSCRLRKAGYCHVIGDDTFIFHEGGGSFAKERTLRMDEGEAAMRRLHPSYYPEVVRFFRANPLRPIQERIHRRLIEEREGDGKKKRVLHILHNGPFAARRDPLGGTEFHVQGLIRHLPEFSHWSLVRSRSDLLLEAHGGGVESTFTLSYSKEELKRILDPNFFDLIHVHHTRWFEMEELTEALQSHGRYLVSLHDFVSICPRFHLFTVQGEHCTGFECASACGYRASEIEQYRLYGSTLLQGAKEVFAFSENTVRYIEKILGLTLSIRLIQHGIDGALFLKRALNGSAPPTLPQKEEGVLRVLTIAPSGKHKGEALIRALFQKRVLPSGAKIEWTVLGNWEKGESSHENSLGPFVRADLPNLIAEIKPDIGILLSLVPESYGLLFDELIQCGLPLVVGPLGAPPERLKKWGAGWVTSELTVPAVLALLDQLAADPKEVERAQAATQLAPVRKEKDEALEFGACYQQYERGDAQLSLQDFLKHFSYGERAPGKLLRLVQRMLDSLKGIIERLKLRAVLLPLLQRVLGVKWANWVKGL